MDQYNAKDLPTEPLRELLETSQPDEIETVATISSGTTGSGLSSNEPSENDKENDAAVVAGTYRLCLSKVLKLVLIYDFFSNI